MQRLLGVILSLVLIGAALAFGGVEPFTYSLVEVVLFICVLLVLLKQTRQGTIDLWLPSWPIFFVLLVVLQTVPLPSSFILSLSPARHLDPCIGGATHSQEEWMTLSIYPRATLSSAFKFLAYLSAFALAAYVFDSKNRKSLLIRALICLGCFEAGYGIFQYLTGSNKIFTYTNQVGWGAGTYINHNHFAGLLELIVPFVVASVFYSYQSWSERQNPIGGARARAGLKSIGFQLVFYLFLLVIMVIGVIFSRSRMGILATVFSIFFVALLVQLKVTRKVWLLGALIFMACTVGYGLWIGLDPVLARFEQIRGPSLLRIERRISIWSDLARLVQDYPLLGTGLGTFGVAFRRYQRSALDKYVDHAHNDYLEFASDTGLVGAALLFLPILYLLIKMIASFLNDARRYRRSITLGCIGSTLAMLIHSLTDFNLQIPANALIFAVVLGIGYKATMLERRDEQADSLRFVPDAAREPNFMAAHRREFGSLNRQ